MDISNIKEYYYLINVDLSVTRVVYTVFGNILFTPYLNIWLLRYTVLAI